MSHDKQNKPNAWHHVYGFHCVNSTHYAYALAALELWEEQHRQYTTFDLSHRGQLIFSFLTDMHTQYHG